MGKHYTSYSTIVTLSIASSLPFTVIPKANSRAAQVRMSTNKITADETWATFLEDSMIVLQTASRVLHVLMYRI